MTREEQPPPVGGHGDVWLEVIAATAREHLGMDLVEDMRDRRELGIARYGQPLRRGDGRDHGVDSYDEALDLCVYLASRYGVDDDLARDARRFAGRIRDRLGGGR